MTVGMLTEKMSSAELTMWMAHDELSAVERDKQQRQAGKGMKPRRRR